MTRTSLVARAPKVVYGVVDDIARYPEFVPGCTAADVLERDCRQVVARLAVRRGPLRTQFTTRNQLDPERSVYMQLVEGPFKVLEGRGISRRSQTTVVASTSSSGFNSPTR